MYIPESRRPVARHLFDEVNAKVKLYQGLFIWMCILAIIGFIAAVSLVVYSQNLIDDHLQEETKWLKHLNQELHDLQVTIPSK